MLLEALINRNMNSRKNALKTESQNLAMNEIAKKHFTYTEPQEHVRKPTMNENAITKLFAPFVRYTR
jgi:hypothetical protein